MGRQLAVAGSGRTQDQQARTARAYCLKVADDSKATAPAPDGPIPILDMEHLL